MKSNSFPPLPLTGWRPTLETLQDYARLIGKVRRAFAPRQKHWFHVSLRVNATGLTTTAIPAGDKTFEMQLDLTAHRLVVTSSRGERWQSPLGGQSPAQFRDEALAALALMGIAPEIDRSLFDNDSAGQYDRAAVESYWLALSQIDALFKQFRGELREETGPVQLWPHHIDLAMLWFSGRLVPGQDPANEEYADEQMNFGFSPGDDTIPEPYFYATAYPTPNGLTATRLPGDAYWHTTGFTGAILPYQALVTAAEPASVLLTYLRTVQQGGAAQMRNSG
ncbi:MAG: DUF5996 family protein [Anaerolineae bacterium]